MISEKESIGIKEKMHFHDRDPVKENGRRGVNLICRLFYL